MENYTHTYDLKFSKKYQRELQKISSLALKEDELEVSVMLMNTDLVVNSMRDECEALESTCNVAKEELSTRVTNILRE